MKETKREMVSLLVHDSWWGCAWRSQRPWIVRGFTRYSDPRRLGIPSLEVEHGQSHVHRCRGEFVPTLKDDLNIIALPLYGEGNAMGSKLVGEDKDRLQLLMEATSSTKSSYSLWVRYWGRARLAWKPCWLIGCLSSFSQVGQSMSWTTMEAYGASYARNAFVTDGVRLGARTLPPSRGRRSLQRPFCRSCRFLLLKSSSHEGCDGFTRELVGAKSSMPVLYKFFVPHRRKCPQPSDLRRYISAKLPKFNLHSDLCLLVGYSRDFHSEVT